MRPPTDDDDDASSDSGGDRADTEETGDGDSVGAQSTSGNGGNGEAKVGTAAAVAAPLQGSSAQHGAGSTAGGTSQVKDGSPQSSAGASAGQEGAEEGSEAGSEAGDRKASVAPNALDRVLRELGVFPLRRQSREASAAAELEARHRAVALAARADAQSLPTRLERAARMREHANRNVNAEADELAKALHRLNYLCKESESIELLGAARQRISFLLRAVHRATTTAETMGALRLEERLSGWMESALNYEDHLRQQLETVRSEQEETRRVLSESGALKDSSLSSPDHLRLTRARSPANKLDLALRSVSTTSRLPSTFRRPLSSASSDSPAGGSYADSISPAPVQTPEEYPSSTNETNEPAGLDEVPEPRNSLESSPRPSAAELPICKPDTPIGLHLRVPHRDSLTFMTVPPPSPTASTFQAARSAVDQLVEQVWPIDLLSAVQVCRWLVARLLLLAAVWFMASAFMTPAEADTHDSHRTSVQRTLQFLPSKKDSIHSLNLPPS